jgi:hypothetical protein
MGPGSRGGKKKIQDEGGGRGRGLINLFEIKTPQVGFCILICCLAGFEKEERKDK